jgi:hypothetical protein
MAREGPVSRPRAVDDFGTIRTRIEQLRREREGSGAEAPGATPETDAERLRRERIEGFPPPWVPTIFLNRPWP